MRRSAATAAVALLGCTQTLVLDVQLLNPCNQQAIGAVDFLRIEPRGRDVDSVGLTTVHRVADNGTGPLPIPGSDDFQIIATGHRGEFSTPPAAIGVSVRFDLSAAEDGFRVPVPFGLVDTFYKTTDLADPASCSTLRVPRYGATATFLPENGRVLVLGGATLRDGAIEFRRAIELYDPATGRFDIVAELRAGGARAFHTATLLADGTVLVTGGEAIVGAATESLRSAMIINARDPNDVTVSDVIAMRKARTGHTASRLSDGRVVLVGGHILNPAATSLTEHTFISQIEVFDPNVGLFRSVSTPDGGDIVGLEAARYGHSATLLGSGRSIVVAGGFNETGPVREMEVVRILGDEVQVVQTGAMSAVGPIFHGAALTQDGRLLLAGGYDTIADALPSGQLPSNSSAAVEMWEYSEPRAELAQSCTGALALGRGYQTVTALGRRMLFVGGRGVDGRPLASAEVATLGVGPSCFGAAPTTIELADARSQHAVALLGSGEVLVVGGRKQDPGDMFGTSISSTEIFNPARDP